MNRLELVAEVAQSTGLTKKDVVAVVDALVETIKETVADGEQVQLVGFGTFSAKTRAAREGRNPATGEAMTIEAKVVPAFKAGAKFKEAVNNA